MAVIGIDCGLNGGISILGDQISVQSMPVKKEDKKHVYDIDRIIDLFKTYQGQEVIFCIEKQGVRPGESGTSALTIGKNYGILIGIAKAFGFNVVIVTPKQWKKSYPELTTSPEMDSMRDKIKSLND